MSPTTLLRCCIVEKDVNDETLIVWAFPSISNQQRLYILRKFQSISKQTHSFVFSKYCKEWCYINISQVFVSDNLPRVKQVGFVTWGRDYNPVKYEILCKILNKKYCKSGSPPEALKLYLSLMITGVCTTEENGMFSISNFESWKKSGTNQVKGLLLNKRLFIYHHNLGNLLNLIQTIPLLMIHKNLETTIFPWIHLESDELTELKCSDGFVAGCTDSCIETLNSNYDIFVNVPAREVTISPLSRDYFVMTKTHKDIALFIVQLSENPNMDDGQVVEEIAKKTQELLDQLRLLASVVTPNGQKVVSIETLRAKNLAPALENFLFNLSVAEKMIML